MVRQGLGGRKWSPGEGGRQDARELWQAAVGIFPGKNVDTPLAICHYVILIIIIIKQLVGWGLFRIMQAAWGKLL